MNEDKIKKYDQIYFHRYKTDEEWLKKKSENDQPLE